MPIASTRTRSRSSAATTQSNAAKVRKSAARTSPETYRHAGRKDLDLFPSERRGATFVFPLNSSRMVLRTHAQVSTVSRGRQSLRSKTRQAVGRLKGTRSIFSPTSAQPNTGPGVSQTHTPTHTLPGRVRSVQRTRVPALRPRANVELPCALRRNIVRKSLARKSERKGSGLPNNPFLSKPPPLD